MTDVEVTPAGRRLLDIQRAQGIPYPTNFLAWQKPHAAAIAAIEVEP
jgi:hypothetical protein